MGNSRIEFQCLILVFKDSCGALNVDVVGSVEPMEQRNVWQQGKQYQWLASQMIVSVEEAEKSVTTGQGHHTEKLGGAYMDFPETLHSILDWSELPEMHRTLSFISTNIITLNS